MSFNPVLNILFWIAATLAPQGTSEITVKRYLLYVEGASGMTVEGPHKTWTWTKHQSGWKLSGLDPSADESVWVREGTTMTATLGERSNKQDVAEFVKGIQEHDWAQSPSLRLGPTMSLTKEGDTFAFTVVDEGAYSGDRLVIEFKKEAQPEPEAGGFPGRGMNSHDGSAHGEAAASPRGGFVDPLVQGIFEDEGLMDIGAAASSYRRIIGEFDQQRVRAAQAIFRLAELHRRAGQMEEAKVYYARILREFPDHGQLAQESLQHLSASPAINRTNGAQPTPLSAPSSGANRSSPATFNEHLHRLVASQAGAQETAFLNKILVNLRQLEGAKVQWALENRKTDDEVPLREDLAKYLRGGFPQPVDGEVYIMTPVGKPPAFVLQKPLRHLPASMLLTVDDLSNRAQTPVNDHSH